MNSVLITNSDVNYTLNILRRARRFAEQEARTVIAQDISALLGLLQQPRLPAKNSHLWGGLDFAFQHHIDFLKEVNATQATLVATNRQPSLVLLKHQFSTLNTLVHALSLWGKFRNYRTTGSKAIA